MSAWIVSKAHIDVLVHAMGKRELLEVSPDEAGRILWAENHRSVNYRYQENTPTPAYRYAAPPVDWTPAQLTKIVGCYSYQSCESHDYEETTAGRMVGDLSDALEREGADGESDEARSAPWGVCQCGGNHEEYACPQTVSA